MYFAIQKFYLENKSEFQACEHNRGLEKFRCAFQLTCGRIPPPGVRGAASWEGKGTGRAKRSIPHSVRERVVSRW